MEKERQQKSIAKEAGARWTMKEKSEISTRVRDFRCGVPYHVYQRGNQGRKTFHDQMARFLYLERVFLLAKRHMVRVHNFCLMPNHVHFVLEQLRVDGISNLMQELQAYHARFHNQRLQETGSLWHQHFGCKRIDSSAYYLTVMKYIENNPARCFREKTPLTYGWSGAQAHVQNEQVEIKVREKVLRTELYLEGWRDRCKEAIAYGWFKILLGRSVDQASIEKIEAMLDGKKRQALAQKERARKRREAKQEGGGADAKGYLCTADTEHAGETELAKVVEPASSEEVQYAVALMRRESEAKSGNEVANSSEMDGFAPSRPQEPGIAEMLNSSKRQEARVRRRGAS